MAEARQRLTDQQLRGLQPPVKGQQLYRDSTLTGFACRVSQGGTKTFVLVHGADRTFTTIGRYPIISLSEAREEARRILAEKTLGKSRPQSITFTAALEQFLEEKRKSRRPSTVENHEQRLTYHFSTKEQLSFFTHQEVSRRLARIPTNSEHDHALSCAKTFFTWCCRRRYLTENPTTGLQAYGSPSRDRVLSDDELEAIWRATFSPGLPAQYGPIVRLLMVMGQRENETANLRSDFFVGDILTLPAWLTKNKLEHIFPIGALATFILKFPIASARQSDTTLLFPARGKTNSPFNGWSKSKSILDEESGVTAWVLHDLRRTYRTGLGRLGVPPHIAERLVNHISAQTDMERVYDKHKYLDEKRAAQLLWEAHLSSILEK